MAFVPTKNWFHWIVSGCNKKNAVAIIHTYCIYVCPTLHTLYSGQWHAQAHFIVEVKFNNANLEYIRVSKKCSRWKYGQCHENYLRSKFIERLISHIRLIFRRIQIWWKREMSVPNWFRQLSVTEFGRKPLRYSQSELINFLHQHCSVYCGRYWNIEFKPRTTFYPSIWSQWEWYLQSSK